MGGRELLRHLVPCPASRSTPSSCRSAEAHAAAGDASVVSVVYDDDLDEVRDFFAEQRRRLAGRLRRPARPPSTTAWSRCPSPTSWRPDGIVVQKYTGGVTQDVIERDIAALDRGRRLAGEGS